jgi:phage terminase large subunit-like protein
MSEITAEGFERFASKLMLDSGKSMRLEPFQRELVDDFTDPDARECWAVLPEASGKSTLMAAFSLYALARLPGANVLVASVTMGQAGSALFRQAADMVANTPGLDRHYRALDSRLRIYGPNRSLLSVRPSNPSTAQGGIPDLVLIDELGELKSLELARMFRGKLSKRAGSRLIVISTAGEPGGEFETTLAEIRAGAEDKFREGRHSRYRSGTTIVHEWRLNADDDVTDWRLLKAANPLSTVTEESLRDKFESPLTDRTHFRRYTAGVAEYDDSHVVARDVWDAAAVTDWDELAGETLSLQVIGVDHAMSYDAWAGVPVILHESGLILLGPAKVIEPRRPGEPIPLAQMQDAMLELAADGADVVWLNPSAGSSDLEAWIDSNVSPVTVYGMTQAEALDLTETFVSALHGGRLRHTGDKTLTGHVLNAVARWNWDRDRFAFTRPKESRRAKVQTTRRIDALSAATLAVKAAMVATRPFIKPKEEAGV